MHDKPQFISIPWTFYVDIRVIFFKRDIDLYDI